MSDVNLARRCDASGSGRLKYEKIVPICQQRWAGRFSLPFACLCRERSVIWLQAAVRLLYTWMHTTGEGVKKPCKTSCDTADCVVTSFQDFRLVVWRRLAFFSMMDIVFILFSSSLGVLSFVFDFRLPFGGRAIHALLLTFEIAFCLTLHPLLK